jgi:small-conductance mechanosensitive channel
VRWLQDLDPGQWLVAGVVLGVALLVGMGLAALVRLLLRRRGDQKLTELISRWIAGPLRVLMPLVTMLVALPAAGLPEAVHDGFHQALQIGAILAATWFAVRVLGLGEQYVISRYDGRADSLDARSVQTRVRVGRNLGVVLVVALGLAWVLTTFDAARELGTSLLASAGVATVVIGFAAQRSLGTLLAGIQIALTEPIRLDDIVVVQGEGGRIEEIGVTYVVVRLWDGRRLVVPITFFVDQPFQNWTWVASGLTGTVDLKLDPRTPVDLVRTELDAILARNAERWDGKTKAVQVVELDRDSVTLRIQVGAGDSGKLFDLRCAVREELLAMLWARAPEAFTPRPVPPAT